MAKKKVNSSNNDEEEKTVLNYLRRVNRPYSATDIFNNLHGKYQKPNIVKSLERLTEKDLVLTKSYGKMSIYTIKQTEDQTSPEEVEVMDQEYETFTHTLKKLKEENSSRAHALAELKNTPTTSAAQALLKDVVQENEENEERLTNLRSGTVLISEADRKRINTEFELNRKEWRQRRKLKKFTEIFKTVTEHLPGNPTEFKEQLGIEEDIIPYDQDPLIS